MIARLRQPVSPELYRRITVVALVLLIFIVVTGAGVRLTGSGLGCTDWPNCTDQRFVAERGDVHAMVEFVNRMITGLVSAAVAFAVLGSLRRAPRRADLVRLSWGLVAGVLAQIALGAVVVKTDLNPWLVQGHFVVSMLLVLDAVVLAHRARLPDDVATRPAVTPMLLRWGQALVGFAVVVILTGTLVTGSGPHSGHNEAEDGATAAEKLRGRPGGEAAAHRRARRGPHPRDRHDGLPRRRHLGARAAPPPPRRHRPRQRRHRPAHRARAPGRHRLHAVLHRRPAPARRPPRARRLARVGRGAEPGPADAGAGGRRALRSARLRR
ncbi:COX15/CtaA family protein [Aquihabitans sp. G128]|nr:COX15/CtaA family protein [Aquihabitans sp. G128]